MRPYPQVLITSLIVGVCLFIMGSCSDNSSQVNANTKLVSTTLASSGLFSTRSLTTSGCGGSFVACVTPTAVTGKAYYAGMIVGTSNGLSLGPLLGTVEDPSEASEFTSTDLIDFDFSVGLSTPASPTIGGPIAYPSDENAYIQNAHIYFGYIDIQFVLGAGDGVPVALRDTHTVRMVMAPIPDLGYSKGDLLYKGSGDSSFMWCSGSACDQTTRPGSPLQISDIASFANPYPEGNPTIPSFYANLADDAEAVQVKQSDLLTKTLTFTWDFTMTNGIKFTSNPTGLTTIYQLVNATRLPADPGDDDSGFTVTISVSE